MLLLFQKGDMKLQLEIVVLYCVVVVVGTVVQQLSENV